ncbi:MAG TPA: response regulator [Geopsychrobacteraceae bacterium]
MANMKVLVVEDSPTMRQLIVFALKRIRGLQIVEANDGVGGLKKLSAEKFELILTDINMPIMDGLKLVSLIRNDPQYKDVPVVVITTEGAQEDRDRALALGANEYITKPIQTAKIIEVVRRLLDVSG